ncbi:hypothetical protein GYMLUDRAFT_68188 [Collybiopsis luxurians FD-317 M1]|nr:hypothetical protein GYMLUDRAFT_68188 [Collybiopsis luxurians FD-317 M1]
MRFSPFALLSLSLAALVSAETIDGLVKRTNDQYCGCISGSLQLNSWFKGRSVTAGSLQEICLCESDISAYIDSDSACKNGINMIGRGNIVTAITGMIQRSSGSKQCSYPDNAKAQCSRSNKCDFQCENGFSKGTKDGKSACVCPSSKSVCGNGQCKNSCPTTRPYLEKRDRLYWGKHMQRTCRPGWTACGIPGGRKNDWECVDTQNDLESCGGCPFITSSLTSDIAGVDCTTLPGVANVACVRGACSVNKCMPGFKISRSGQHCEVDEREATGPFKTPLQVFEGSLFE